MYIKMDEYVVDANCKGSIIEQSINTTVWVRSVCLRLKEYGDIGGSVVYNVMNYFCYGICGINTLSA